MLTESKILLFSDLSSYFNLGHSVASCRQDMGLLLAIHKHKIMVQNKKLELQNFNVFRPVKLAAAPTSLFLMICLFMYFVAHIYFPSPIQVLSRVHKYNMTTSLKLSHPIKNTKHKIKCHLPLGWEDLLTQNALIDTSARFV